MASLNSSSLAVLANIRGIGLGDVWTRRLVAVWAARLRVILHASRSRGALLNDRGLARRTTNVLLKILSFMVEGVVDVPPLALESNSRMQDGQTGTSEDEHNALQYHEQCLVTDKEMASETARELDTSVHASNEDCDGGDDEADEESLEEARVDEVGVSRVPRALAAPHVLREPTCGDGE